MLDSFWGAGRTGFEVDSGGYGLRVSRISVRGALSGGRRPDIRFHTIFRCGGDSKVRSRAFLSALLRLLQMNERACVLYVHHHAELTPGRCDRGHIQNHSHVISITSDRLAPLDNAETQDNETAKHSTPRSQDYLTI